MALSELERQAGRLFRAERQGELDELNAAEPPGGDVLALWRWVPHDCPERGGASIRIGLREHYQANPRYKVCYCSVIAVDTSPEGDFPHWDCGANKVALAEGVLAWIWKDGRCADCGLVLRTARGRLVIAADRPPDREYAVARQDGPPRPHDRDPGVARA